MVADRFHGYEISVNPARRELRLGRHRNNFDLIRDVPCELPVGEWIELSVSRQGTRIAVRVNGKTMVSHEGRNAGTSGGSVWIDKIYDRLPMDRSTTSALANFLTAIWCSSPRGDSGTRCASPALRRTSTAFRAMGDGRNASV